MYCAVFGCSNNNKINRNNWRFFRFPKDKNVCKQWVLRCCQQNKFNLETARICSDHFLESDYCLKHKLLKLPQNKWKLKSDAIPSKCLIKTPKGQTPNQQKRDMRMKKRLIKELICDTQPKIEVSNNEVKAEPDMSDFQKHLENEHEKGNRSEKTRTVSSQTKGEIDLLEKIKILQSENEHLKKLLHKEREEKRAIEKIFTERLIRRLKTVNVVQWSIRDLSADDSL